jgi:hypothetical protein
MNAAKFKQERILGHSWAMRSQRERATYWGIPRHFPNSHLMCGVYKSGSSRNES